jgi:exodeoxyribonuclease V alpha subunit
MASKIKKERNSMKFDVSQRAAIEYACASRFCIIDGKAGSGKTTLIKEIAGRVQSPTLCAFAGKAAARLREATGFSASTIHRMMSYDGTIFRLDTLEGLSVIMDEASMVDSWLMAEVIRRNPAKLVLVGDPAQLPPVGRGQPFHDLIRLRPEHVRTLTTCYRAREAVFSAANDIRAGNKPPQEAQSDGERWSMMNTGNPEMTHKKLMKWVEQGAFDFLQDLLLVARNGERDTDPCTVRSLNRDISRMLLPRDDKTRFVVGDRVINTKNLPELDCWNGTTGTIHAIDIDGGIWIATDLPVTIDGNQTSRVLFGKDVVKHLQLAYALTVHKAQGSQARRVVFAAFKRDAWGMLDRKLLYTAVTRTKQACCVVGEREAAVLAIDRDGKKRTVMQIFAGTEAKPCQS